jgi:hypothetical protein
MMPQLVHLVLESLCCKVTHALPAVILDSITKRMSAHNVMQHVANVQLMEMSPVKDVMKAGYWFMKVFVHQVVN